MGELGGVPGRGGGGGATWSQSCLDAYIAVRILVWPIERTHISLTRECYVLSYLYIVFN